MGTLAPESRKHSITRPEGPKQPPTSVVPKFTLLVTPAGNVVPAGKVMLIRLLAAPESPPVPDVPKAMAYCVVADAAGFATATVIARTELPGTTVKGPG